MNSQAIDDQTLFSQTTDPLWSEPLKYAPKPRKVKKILKATRKVIDFVEAVGVTLKGEITVVRDSLCTSCDVLSVIDLPRRCRLLCRQIQNLQCPEVIPSYTKAGIDIVKSVSNLANTTASYFELANDHGFIALSARQLIVLTGVGFIASFAGTLKSGYAIQRDFLVLIDRKKTCNRKLYLLRLATQISYFALGIFAMMAVIYGAQVVSLPLLAGISLLSLALSLSKKYYKNIYKNQIKQDIS